jgi:hypothetical protein
VNDRERIIEAARLQRTLLRLVGAFVVMLARLVWSLRQSWDWVTFVAIPGTLISVLVVEVVNIALQAKMRWSWPVIGLHLLLPLGIGAWCMATGGIGMAAGFMPVMIIFDCVFVNGRVTKALANAGVRVGFLGVREEELRRLRSGVCFFCGYDMAGLPTSVCPECGKQSVPGQPDESLAS